MTQKNHILTGIKPTGTPHLGNYVGMMRPAIDMANAAGEKDKSFLFIADYHALNAVHDAAALYRDTAQLAATYLALGLDPAKTVFYRQSDVPEIFELMTILAAVTPKGLIDRSHAYKAQVDINRAENRDVDFGVNMGLYTYPLLMAADILMVDTTLVPVGKDQVQHVEFARDIAGYFNNTYGETLTVPAHRVEEGGGYVLGLDGRKMSKSYNNHIPIFMEAKQRQKLVMKIVTDSKQPDEPKDPDENTIFQLYRFFGTDAEIAEMRTAFERGGMGYGDAKKLLAAAIERTLEAPSARYADYMADLKKVEDILQAGAAAVRPVARDVLMRVRDKIGVRPLV